MKPIVVGDIATLISGGPMMTVSHVPENTTTQGVQCTWYNDKAGKMELMYFPVATLRIRNAVSHPQLPAFGSSQVAESSLGKA